MDKRKKKRKDKKKKGRKIGQREKEKTWEKRKKGGKRKGRFSWRSDGRISTVRELKSIQATRATRGYQNVGVSSNSKTFNGIGFLWDRGWPCDLVPRFWNWFQIFPDYVEIWF